jgi:DNA-binding transcriptional LysR family regulator
MLTAQVIETAARTESQLSLNFQVDARATLLEAVVDRRVQACFVFPPAISSPEIRVDYLTNEPIMAAVHARHRLAGRADVDLSDLAGEPFVLWERTPAPEIYDDIIAACQKAGFSPRVISHVPEPISALLLTSAGLAVTLVPASLRSAHVGQINFIPLTNRSLNTSLALITRADEHLSGVGLLRKHALAVAASARGQKRGDMSRKK